MAFFGNISSCCAYKIFKDWHRNFPILHVKVHALFYIEVQCNCLMMETPLERHENQRA